MTPPPFERLQGQDPQGSHLPSLPDRPGTRQEVEANPGLLIVTTQVETSLSENIGFGNAREILRLPPNTQLNEEQLRGSLAFTLNQGQNGHPLLFLTHMRIWGAILSGVDHEGANQNRQQHVVPRVPEAIRALQGAPIHSRERVMRLFELAQAVAAAFLRPTRDALPNGERQAMVALFTAIRQALQAHEQTRGTDPQFRPSPPYMRPYCEAQLALLNGDAEDALPRLLETRRILEALPPSQPQENGLPGIRDQITIATLRAIQLLPRDTSGLTVHSFRRRVGWELLSYFYQIDYLREHGEGQAQAAQRQAQQFNLIAGLAEDYGVQPASGNQQFGQNETEGLVQILMSLYQGNQEFRRLVGTLGLGNLSDENARKSAFERMIDNAERVYRHIHQHREAEPYRSARRWLNDQDLVSRIAGQLGERSELKNALAELIGIPNEIRDQLPNDRLVRMLAEYGPLLSIWLQHLPEAIRNAQGNRATLDLLRRLGQGLETDESARQNLTQPIEGLYETLDSLRANHPQYAPAYGALYQSLSQLRNIVPNQEFPEGLRNRARQEAQETEGFSWRQTLDHLTEPESIAMILGGAIFTEWAGGRMLARAAGTEGNWRSLVRGGQLTWRGEFAIGMGVAAGMTAAGAVTHLVTSGRPWGEEAWRMLPGIVVGTIANGLALGGTMAASHGLRRTVLSEARIASPFARASLHRLANIGLGGTLMLGGNAVTRRVMTGNWESPQTQEVIDTLLLMAAYDLTAAGIRRVGNRFWWRRQLGPHRAQAVDTLSQRLHQANPQIEEAVLRNYLGLRVARGRGLGDIETALNQGREPYLDGTGRGQTLAFRQGSGGRPAGGEPSPSRQTPALPEAARRHAHSAEFQESMGDLYREVAVRLINQPNPSRVWIEVGERGRFTILGENPSGVPRNPRNTFSMGPDGVPQETDGLADSATREALVEYGRYLRETGGAEALRINFVSLAQRRGPSPNQASGNPQGATQANPPQTARPIPELTSEQRAFADEIFMSPDFGRSLRGLIDQVQTVLQNQPEGTTTWVRATRSRSMVVFIPLDAQPAMCSTDVSFRMDSRGRITHLSEGDIVLRAVLENLPNNRILPPSSGTVASPEPQRPSPPEPAGPRRPARGPAPRPAEEAIEEVSAEALEEIASGHGAAPLRPPPIPGAARRTPPPLPPRQPAPPAEPAAPAERPSNGSPRPQRASPDSAETETVDLGDLLAPETLASATDALISQAEGRPSEILMVEINARPGEALFRVVDQVPPLDSRRGFFVLRRVPSTQASGTVNTYVLAADPVLPEALRNTEFGRYLHAQFARTSMGFTNGGPR